MIESISIAGIATYPNTPETLSGLSQFNYVFGSNATGKTTISRVISDEAQFPSCSVTWRNATKLQPMVYSRDFVERNFTHSRELRGVFTLGEDQVETLATIESKKAKLDELTSEITRLSAVMQGADGTGGKKGDLATLERGMTEKAWRQKQKFDSMHVKHAITGFRASRNEFWNQVLRELESNKAPLLPLSELEKNAESVYAQKPSAAASVPTVDFAPLLHHEAHPILSKRVIGKDDVDIAAMIIRLGNSDWVRAGRDFYDVNGGVCPFCQRITPETFARSLADYFDETFLADSNAIADLAAEYAADAARVQLKITAIIASPSRFLDTEKLRTEKELLENTILLNNQRISGKRKEPSVVRHTD